MGYEYPARRAFVSSFKLGDIEKIVNKKSTLFCWNLTVPNEIIKVFFKKDTKIRLEIAVLRI